LLVIWLLQLAGGAACQNRFNAEVYLAVSSFVVVAMLGRSGSSVCGRCIRFGREQIYQPLFRWHGPTTTGRSRCLCLWVIDGAHLANKTAAVEWTKLSFAWRIL
jgi:hypothetical protein